ncbi:esterase-like activity of phytase family protein [Corynebacterium uterequi]|uniref:Phytase-like domain-containing protein n=1 Tax=Corynebacterium uterequi TaxID=1072256 RepID=A0A0G3HDM5_9CORY|nr:esterase-like activity of phytase family protein [Corynebacterium uterequi]AKK10805.1 hypothetical protein CUTER_03995 [Corynebacterium uterequi]
MKPLIASAVALSALSISSILSPVLDPISDLFTASSGEGDRVDVQSSIDVIPGMMTYRGYQNLADAAVNPYNKDVIAQRPVGGLSGIDRAGDLYLAISDDKNDARAYAMTVTGEQVTIEDVIALRDAEGKQLNDVDPEGIRMLPNGTFLWSDEGWAKEGRFESPRIIHADRDGTYLREFEVPAYHAPNAEGTRGIHHNNGPEALGLTNDGRAVTVNENALAQDGPRNTEEAGSRTRVTFYNIGTGKADSEYVLDIGPLYPGATDRGISSIVGSEDGSLFVLERGFVPGKGNSAEIYRLNFDGATDVLGKEALDGSETPVTKKMVFDFAGNDEHPENVEGMVWGVPEAFGEEDPQLLVVSDDNFNAPSQRTLLHRLSF